MAAFLGEVGGCEIDGMRLGGSASPMAFSAPRTRSRLSATALSGSPTMVKAGSPGPIWTLHVDGARLDALRTRPW